MRKKTIIGISLGLLLIICSLFIGFRKKEGFVDVNNPNDNTIAVNKLNGTVVSVDQQNLVLQDRNSIIYTFDNTNLFPDVGSDIDLEYNGTLDKNKSEQNVELIRYTVSNANTSANSVPSNFQDNGIFSDYYPLAYNKLKTLSLDEKIGQLFLVRYPNDKQLEVLKQNNFGGYIFFAKDFQNKTTSAVKDEINKLQQAAKIPLLTAVDEEGGTVVRVSSNPNLVPEKFKSSQELYDLGGFEQIKKDTIEKSKVLRNLGLNLNLAPVVDVSTDPNDYMYKRSFGKNTELTSTYAKTVIEASKGTGVSYTLKHFPGYGNNADTHTGSVVDERTYDDIVAKDLPPFKAGINAKAEAVLVSHNTVKSIDPANPASLSPSVHNLLRNELGFTGIIITDDIAMGATSTIDNVALKALLAGNDLIITTDYAQSINQIKTALTNGTISENLVDRAAFRIIAWKYYKGLMFENTK